MSAVLAPRAESAAANAWLQSRYRDCRQDTLALIDGLGEGDLTAQSMAETSPGKWHLAHTSWFFEAFVLLPHAPRYRAFEPAWAELFNSYFSATGTRLPRACRGLLTRPTLAEVLAWRRHVDHAIADWLEQAADDDALALLELGLRHEQQHQELMRADLLNLFARQPLRPAYRRTAAVGAVLSTAPEARWVVFRGGRCAIGRDADDGGFSFDCERPRHELLQRPFGLAALPVSNRDWCEFTADGGYTRRSLWLAEGWRQVRAQGWDAPLYWRGGAAEPRQMTLAGELVPDPAAPVCHVSFYEADAFARWAGKRLPTEAEWEIAAAAQPVAGNFAASGWLRPVAAHLDGQGPLRQLYGDVWEWTSSPFTPYPGYACDTGVAGEYDGRFMCNRFVLRGGSCATPFGAVGASRRNFLQPHQRWQFSGLRLAEDR